MSIPWYYSLLSRQYTNKFLLSKKYIYTNKFLFILVDIQSKVSYKDFSSMLILMSEPIWIVTY